MQNSGLGNAINPLASIAHHKKYIRFPFNVINRLAWIITQQDEPQHMVKGKITKNLLSLLGIKFIILKKDTDIQKIG